MSFRHCDDARSANDDVREGDRVAWVCTELDGQFTATGVVERVYSDGSARVLCDDNYVRAAQVALLWRVDP